MNKHLKFYKYLTFIILFFIFSFLPSFIFAEAIVLKSGQKIEGKLIEKTDKYIILNIMDVSVPYFLDDIVSIDGKAVSVQTKSVEKTGGGLKLKQNFSYDKSRLIDLWFFPVEKACWNGYEVLNSDWRSLDNCQKNKFVSEALKEIEIKENVKVLSLVPNDRIILSLDKLANLFGLSDKKIPVITTLLLGMNASGYIQGEIITFAPNHPFLCKQIIAESNKENPTVELGKTYTGYICCYKKDGAWLPDSEGPLVGEIKRRIFFADRIMVPNGATMLCGNYPLNFEYKMLAFREINSFTDQCGLENYYYKVIFEPIKEIF